jgi:hypothetical protein
MISIKKLFSNIKLGWLLIFATFTLWKDHLKNKSTFWVNGIYCLEQDRSTPTFNWLDYEYIIKTQKKPRGRAKPKYPNTIAGFLKWRANFTK